MRPLDYAAVLNFEMSPSERGRNITLRIKRFSEDFKRF